MVSFRGNSIHAPSRDPSVLPSEARVTCGARGGAEPLSWRGSPEVRAADGSIISARVSHSHACDLPPRIAARLSPGPGNLRERERESEQSRNPKPIVLQLLTARLLRNRMKDSLLSNALTPVRRSVLVTAPLRPPYCRLISFRVCHRDATRLGCA